MLNYTFRGKPVTLTYHLHGEIEKMPRAVKSQILNEIVRRITETITTEKIILFGSHAWGEPGESSDIDLFIIVPHSEEPSYRRPRRIYRSLRGIEIPIDIIVQTHDEVEQGKRVATSLAKIVLEKGNVLYG